MAVSSTEEREASTSSGFVYIAVGLVVAPSRPQLRLRQPRRSHARSPGRGDELALNGLAERGIMQLDDERRAAMVSDLLVVLCSDHEATPVVNTGTFYN